MKTLVSMFAFHPLEMLDHPLLLAWLQKEHVKRWWDDGDDTLAKVAEHYGPPQQPGASPPSEARFIIHKAGHPIGYIQYYLLGGDTAGIDLFIGKESEVGRGQGSTIIRAFVALILSQHPVHSVIVDPSPENKRAIRCYEKAGFRHVETRIMPNGQPEYLMRLDIPGPSTC